MHYETRVTTRLTTYGKEEITESVPVYNKFEQWQMRRKEARDANNVDKPSKSKVMSIITDPTVISVFVIIFCIIIAYMLYSASVEMDKISELYSSLSNRQVNSKVGFDKKLHYISIDDNGDIKVSIGFQSEIQEQEAVQSYNEAATTITPAPQVPVSDVKSGLYNGLADMGYPLEAICGIMGNAQHESGFNLGNIQNKSRLETEVGDGATNAIISSSSYLGTPGCAIGLFQWDSGRAASLVQHSMNASVEWATLEAQMSYLVAELNGAEKNRGVNPSNILEGMPLGADPVEWACYKWAKKFERCGGTSDATWETRTSITGWSGRLSNARNLYIEYGEYR